MKTILILVVLVAVSSGCSSVRVREKFTDPAHRIFVDPSGLNPEDYVKVQTSMVEANKFFVVDRARAFKAIEKEQKMIHRDRSEEFSDEEKYALYGRLYSVGAVIVASEACENIQGVFSWEVRCRQYLSAVDASTGEVIAAASAVASSSPRDGRPEWDEVVDKFNKAFPKTWEPKQYDSKMQEFRKVAAESAARSKESKAQNQIKNGE
jgi:hypothetical protein